jgi:hypothetical protein
MFYAEHSAQPKAFSSVPAAMWWAVVRMTTLGYGDGAAVARVSQHIFGAAVDFNIHDLGMSATRAFGIVNVLAWDKTVAGCFEPADVIRGPRTIP